MATASFSSVAGTKTRSIFTEFGPIVKRNYVVGSSNDAILTSVRTCVLPSIFLDAQSVGRKLRISGSTNPINNGTFSISSVDGNTVTLLDASFNLVDEFLTSENLVKVVNELKHKYNSHRVSDSHTVPDNSNTISLPDCIDTSTAVTLVNAVRAAFISHFQSSVFHKRSHSVAFIPNADDLESAVFLAEELIYEFRIHVQDLDYHESTDLKNYMRSVVFKDGVIQYPPLQWELIDEKKGIIANLPSDVTVRVNGSDVEVEKVVGLLGLIVLKNEITPGSTVEVYYDYLKNPEIGLGALNDFSYTLNQWGNKGEVGLPFNYLGNLNNKTYRVSSYLSNSKNVGVAKPSELPLLFGWKFKGFSREYSSGLNDPNRLLLNSPVRSDVYSVFSLQDSDRTSYYFPTSSPVASGWISEGVGETSFDGSLLKITDSNYTQGLESQPPYFYKEVDVKSDSLVYSSFRFYVSDYTNISGVFTGVSFGFIQDGRACVVGALETEASNLSSAIVTANNVKRVFEEHVLSTSYHYSSDPSNVLPFRDADDLPSLLNLLNALQTAFNSHVSKAPDVHSSVGVGVLFQEARDIESAVTIVNELRAFVLIHFSSTVHKEIDPSSPSLVKQIGVYTGGDFSSISSWSSFAHDWSVEKTVRIVQENSNTASLFLTDYIGPVISVQDLPLASSVPFKLDTVSGIYFGSVGNFQGNTSYWNHVHFSILPYVDTTIGVNRSVSYTTNVLPEFSQDPWVPVGQDGSSRIVSSSLILDSSSSVSEEKSHELGNVTGAFIGYLKVENAILPNNTFVCDFGFSSSSWIHGVDRSSLGVHIEDGELSLSLSFLQASPSPATVTSSVEPFGITLGDTLDFKIDSDSYSVNFDGVYTTASSISSFINSSVGFSLTHPSSGTVVFEVPDRGASHSIDFSASFGLTKLGIDSGKYQGSDTNPEVVVSWSGFEFPTSEPFWTSFGGQSAEVIDRKLRISDSSNSDFLSYQYSSQSAKKIFSGSWRSSFKLSNSVFYPSSPINASSVFSFCGASVIFDEGTSGKNFEIHMSVDSNSNPYLVVYSLDYSTNKHVFIKSMPCSWTSGAHSFDVYVNKESGNVSVLFDTQYLGSFSYSILFPGDTESFIFGSGSPDSSNANVSGSRSAWTWEFLSVYSDKKLSDPYSAQSRYVAIYAGGDENDLNSYYKVQHDWSVHSSYRIIKDPNKGVLVFVNGTSSPSITVPYDSIKLPPASTSVVKRFGLPGPSISFGAFSGTTISRSRWTNIEYSAGKIVTPGRRVPQSMTLNRANTVVSFEHQVSKGKHADFTTSVSSSGSPSYVTLGDLDPYLKLAPGVVPVQMTENLENRGGLQIVTEKVSSIPANSVVSRSGLTSVFVDDKNLTGPTLTSYAVNIGSLINRVNELKTKANSHYFDTSIHKSSDALNTIVTANATNLTTAITLANACRSSLFAHYPYAVSHVNQDTFEPGHPACSDYLSCLSLVESLFSSFDAHRLSSVTHSFNDYAWLSYGPQVRSFLESLEVLNASKASFNAHLSQAGVHLSVDFIDTVLSPDSVDLPSAIALATELRTNYLNHRSSLIFHTNQDTNNSLDSAPFVSESDIILFSNRIKAVFNSHSHEPGVHPSDDNVNLVFVSPQESLSMNIQLLNELKGVYNAHSMSTRFHLVGGAVQVLSPDASDLASAIVLADDIRTTFNDHKSFPGVHSSNDTDVFSDPSPSDLDSLSLFVLNLKKAVLAHLSKRGIHGRNDMVNVLSSPPSVDLSTACTSLVELHSKFNSHILNVQSHKEQDLVSTTTLSSPTTFNTAKASFEEIKVAFLNHVPSIKYHVNGDTVYPDFTPVTDILSLCYNVELLKSSYSNHLVEPGVHGNDDLSQVSSLSAYHQIFELMEQISTNFTGHRSSSSHNGNKDFFGFPSIEYSLDSEDYRVSKIGEWLNSAGESINQHMDSREHAFKDLVHKVPLPLPSSGISQSYASLQILQSSLNLHMIGKTYHTSPDSQTFVTLPVDNIYEQAYHSASVLYQVYSNHVKSLASHVRVVKSTLQSPPPYDPTLSNFGSLMSFVNDLKKAFNAHIVDNNHLSNDPTNAVLSADCTSILSTVTLLNEISVSFSSHGVAPDVHSGMVLVTLESPDRVIYQSMEFFKSETGESDDNSTFVDESS